MSKIFHIVYVVPGKKGKISLRIEGEELAEEVYSACRQAGYKVLQLVVIDLIKSLEELPSDLRDLILTTRKEAEEEVIRNHPQINELAKIYPDCRLAELWTLYTESEDR